MVSHIQLLCLSSGLLVSDVVVRFDADSAAVAAVAAACTTKVDGAVLNPLCVIFGLLQLEDVVKKLAVQLLVGVIDAELLEGVLAWNCAAIRF